MKRLMVAAALFAAALLTPAVAEQELAGHRVANEFVGNTITGQYRDCGPRMDFFEYYDANGEIRGKERACNVTGDWSQYVGKWEVKDGKFCVYFSSGRASGCWSYTAITGGIRRQGSGGDMEYDLTILAENPEHL